MSLKFNIIFGILLVAVFLSPVWTANIGKKTDVKNYINTVNQKMFLLYDEIYRLTFNKHQYDYLADLNIIDRTIDEIVTLTSQAQTYSSNNAEDPELKTALMNIKRSAFLYILGSEDYNELSIILDEMLMPVLRSNLCDYQKDDHCELLYNPDIKNLIAQNNYDSKQLLYYWSDWRARAEVYSRPKFPRFVELFEKAANKTGVNSIQFLYNCFKGDTKIIEDMKQVMNDIKPFYDEFHGYIRNELNKHFGDEVVSKTGPIPDHIFQVVLLQAWKKNSIVKQPYPKNRLPNLKAGLQSQKIKDNTVIDKVENYFDSIGFKKLPSQIISNIKKFTEKELDPECKAEIYDQTPNIRMKYCPKLNFKRFLQMHGYMARLHYAYEKRDLPFHYYHSYDFGNAVAEAIILSASSSEHLTNLGIVSNSTYTHELQMNHLFRMGVHTLFNIPIYYVHAKLMEGILNGKISFANINIEYWKLMEEYAGVEPPVNRNIEALDMSHKFYADLKENRLISKFVSEIVGYQLYESLCLIAGQYDEKRIKKNLHSCNLEGHNEVGQTLINMMKLGSKKSWSETLGTVTGNNNGLSAKGLLNYYAPLRIWLKEQLKENRINIGWTPTTKVLAVNLKSAVPR